MATAAVSIAPSSCLLRALIQVQSLRAQIRRELKALTKEGQGLPQPPSVGSNCSNGSASTSSGSSAAAAPTAVPKVPALALGRAGFFSSQQQQPAGDQWSAGELGQRPRALDDLHLSFSNALYESELATVSDEEDWGGWVSASEAEPRPRRRTPRGTPRITPRSRHGSRPASRSCSRSCTPGRMAPNTGGSAPSSALTSSQQGRPTPLRSALNKLNAGSAGLGLLSMNSSPNKASGAPGSGRTRHSSDAVRSSVQGASFLKLPSRKLLDGVTFKAGSINNTPRESQGAAERSAAVAGGRSDQGAGGAETTTTPMLMYNPTADLGGISNENSPAVDLPAAGLHHSSRQYWQHHHQYGRAPSSAVAYGSGLM